jgi:hypothetical protein
MNEDVERFLEECRADAFFQNNPNGVDRIEDLPPSPSPPLENEMQFRSQQFQPIKADPPAAINAEGREGHSSRCQLRRP